MTELMVSSYVTVRDGCPMRHRVVKDTVEFTFGGFREPFEFAFDTGSLREFLRVGTAALGEMEARPATP
jgi:hypothetical protein